jgi:hypothetical protein
MSRERLHRRRVRNTARRLRERQRKIRYAWDGVYASPLTWEMWTATLLGLWQARDAHWWGQA